MSGTLTSVDLREQASRHLLSPPAHRSEPGHPRLVLRHQSVEGPFDITMKLSGPARPFHVSGIDGQLRPQPVLARLLSRVFEVLLKAFGHSRLLEEIQF